MDRWSLAETEAALASRAIGIWTLRFAFGCGAGPPAFSGDPICLRRLVCLTRRLSRHSGRSRMIEGMRPKDLSAIGAVRSDQVSELRGALDVCSLSFVRAPTALFARAILDSALRWTTRLGADDRAAFLGRGSQGFDALDAMRRHHWRADLTSWPRMSRRLHDENSRSNALGRVVASNNGTPWLELVASLGRCRTSTVNDGTVRLKEALDQLTAGGNWSAITLRGKARQSITRQS